MQLRTKATEASKFITKNGCAYYKQMMEKNKEYVQDPPSVENCTRLAKQLFYTRVARYYLGHNSLLFDACYALFGNFANLSAI